MSDAIEWMSAAELAGRIRRREVSPVEVVDACLDRIERHNPALNAFVTLLGDDARAAAREAEAALASGRPVGPLHGVPVAIKDLFDFKAGVRNTFGCRPLQSFVPEVSGTYVRRLEEAGAIIVGKTNTSEIGHKGTCDNALWGPTVNPFDRSMNAGGSSGGSAAAVATGLVPLAQGSDAGGSIRIPASCCGVYGLKPSYGRAAYAIRPNAFLSHTPFIHAGPITRTVEDAALMLDAIAGPDPRDPFSLPAVAGGSFVAATRTSIEGMRIAFSADLGSFPVDPEVVEVVEGAVAAFESAGARVERIEGPLRHDHLRLSNLWVDQMSVLYAEIAELFKGAGVDLIGDHREDLAPELAGMIERGGECSAVRYKLDDWLRTEVFDAVQDTFETYDLLVSPTLAVPAVPNAPGGRTLGPERINGRPVERTIGWCLTHPFNFTGHPAASAPAGLTRAGLPVGLQIVGPRFADAEVLAASAAVERVRPWGDTYRSLLMP